MNDYKWKKKGMIYEVSNDNEHLLSHASNPLAINLENDVYRIFYSGRDSKNRSSVSYVDIDIVKQQVTLDFKKPVLKYGSPTSFYSHGITLGNSWKQKGETYIGFMGWQHRGDDHWRGDIGKFNVSTFETSMVLGVNEIDKVSLSYPCVIKDDARYKMWYGSTIDWSSENGEMIHTLNYAESDDGNRWDTKGVAIPWALYKAQAFSKPSVIKTDKGYRMWYSYRKGDGSLYRMGYSFSKDGINWSREESNLKKSQTGWDSEMVCYPYVFKHKEDVYMLYNGNRFGKCGFGLAIAI